MDFWFQLRFTARLFVKQLIGVLVAIVIIILLYNICLYYFYFLGRFLPELGLIIVESILAIITGKALKNPEIEEVKRDNKITYYEIKLEFYSMIGMCILGVVLIFIYL